MRARHEQRNPYPFILNNGDHVIREVCRCQHTTDEHFDTMAYGHGQCAVCDCAKFTWSGFETQTPEAQVAMAPGERSTATITRDLIAAGFARCPNVYARWYAAGPGINEPAWPLELDYSDDHGLRIVCWPYGKFNAADRITVLRFTDVIELTGYLERHGRVSLPGLPPYSNAWD